MTLHKCRLLANSTVATEAKEAVDRLAEELNTNKSRALEKIILEWFETVNCSDSQAATTLEENRKLKEQNRRLRSLVCTFSEAITEFNRV